MSKIQKRRTISLSRDYHDALTLYAQQHELPISRIVEARVHSLLVDAGLIKDTQKKTGVAKYWDPEIKRWRPQRITNETTS